MVEVVKPCDNKLSAELQVRLCENLIHQPGQGAEVWRLYRDRWRNIVKSADLFVTRSLVKKAAGVAREVSDSGGTQSC
jgi:hypothetical protein